MDDATRRWMVQQQIAAQEAAQPSTGDKLLGAFTSLGTAALPALIGLSDERLKYDIGPIRVAA
jgi:hypothetical protein